MKRESFIATHVKDVPPSGIRKFFDIASGMKDAISLGVGEPDFVTPWNIRESAIFSIEKGMTHYTSNYGTIKLRRLISKYLDMRFSLSYDPEKQILVTVGASEALDLCFRAVIDPGDEVLIPAPSYVSYMPSVTFANGVPVAMECFEEDEFKLRPEAIEKAVTEKTKAIVLPFPNNPTGAIMTLDDYREIVDIIVKHDLFVISDEIYSELTYSGRHVSIAEFPEIYDRCVVINGFSKSFAMTGFRLGYAAGPEEVIKAIVKIHQYSMLCAPTVSQIAGEEALSYEMDTNFAQVKKMRDSYNRRRLFLNKALNDMGLHCFEPKGAFYMFPNITSTGLTSQEFCTRLIKEKRVACVPGDAFGESGEGFIRCSYASSMQNLTEAVKRMKAFLDELK